IDALVAAAAAEDRMGPHPEVAAHASAYERHARGDRNLGDGGRRDAGGEAGRLVERLPGREELAELLVTVAERALFRSTGLGRLGGAQRRGDVGIGTAVGEGGGRTEERDSRGKSAGGF